MSQYVFGVDIGGTTVKLGYFDTEGNVLDKWEIPTRKEDNGSRILPDVAASIEKKIKDAGIDRKDVAGVGVGAPGPIDSDGVVHKAANLGWGVFSIKETLENIKKGVLYSKDSGDGDTYSMIPPTEDVVSYYSVDITTDKGRKVHIGNYATAEELDKAISDAVKTGQLTQEEANAAHQ